MPAMLRVLMVSKALVVGAYQRKLEAIAAEPDITLDVVVPPAWADQPLERRFTRGYSLHVLPLRFNGNFHLHHYPDLPRLMRQLGPQLVHIDEEPYNLATWLIQRQARQLGARSLFFSWQNIARRYPPPFAWLERDVLRHSHGAIFGNHEAAQVFAAKGYTGPAIVLPQFGIDPALFPLRPARPTNPRFTVGYVGRLVPEKGADLLIRALTDLPEVALHVVGRGDHQPQLAALAAKLAVADRVSFTPWMDSTAIPAFLATLDALALPSRTRPNWKEQFGRVLIEAMAVGVPVIGAHSGEIPGVIGEAGLLFAEDDLPGLAAAIRTLHHDPRAYQQLVRAGRERVLAHFTQARIAAETAEFYRRIVATPLP